MNGARISRAAFVVSLLFVTSACKSQEDKAREAAIEQMGQAAAQMAEAGKTLARQTAAQGAEAAAQGAQAAAQGMQGAAQAMQQWAQAMQQARGAPGPPGAAAVRVQPVDFRALKDLLPKALAELPRKRASGEKAGISGMTISQASATYQAGDQRIELKIVDTGGLVGPMAFAAMGLAMAEIDREDEDGYERTSMLNGHKVFEKWHQTSRHGEYKVLVAGRFVVDVEGDGLPMATLAGAAAELDLGKLAALGASASQR